MKKLMICAKNCYPQLNFSIHTYIHTYTLLTKFKFITRKTIVHNPKNRLRCDLFNIYVIIISTPGYGLFCGLFQGIYECLIAKEIMWCHNKVFSCSKFVVILTTNNWYVSVAAVNSSGVVKHTICIIIIEQSLSRFPNLLSNPCDLDPEPLSRFRPTIYI